MKTNIITVTTGLVIVVTVLSVSVAGMPVENIKAVGELIMTIGCVFGAIRKDGDQGPRP